MKFFILTLLLSSTLVFATGTKMIIKKEFTYDNARPSLIGTDYAFLKKGKDWIIGLEGLKAFRKCKLIEIDELGQDGQFYKAKLTAECIE